MSYQTQIPEILTTTYAIAQSLPALDAGWRTFPGHYLLYAASGAFHLEVRDSRWLLPPQRAAWVAAHVPVRISTESPVTCCSVLFAESTFPKPAFTCRVFAVSTLVREMLLHATRWGPGRAAADVQADHFFQALADVCLELAAQADEFWLPKAHSVELGVALAYSLDHLPESPTFSAVAAAAHVSERTLARRFAEETGMTWRQFMRRARIIQAMERLGKAEPKVVDIAYAVGFTSISAFNHAFREFTGETPSLYRKRFEAR